MLGTGKELDAERCFFRPVHLRFDDVHCTGPGVTLGRVFEIMQGDQARNDGIHNALKDFIAFGVQNCRIGHQMADISDEHERPARQHKR